MATGTVPRKEVNTPPFCGACGWDVRNNGKGNLGNDVFCDACGADLVAFGFLNVLPPDDLVATAGSLQVTFTWTPNAGADSTDFQSSIDGADPVVVLGATSPEVIAALEGEVVAGQVRSVTNGVDGPWSEVEQATALA